MLKTTRESYEVVASREPDGLWVIEVAGLPFGRTQARTIDTVEKMAREAIAIVEDIGENDFDVSITIETPEHVAEALNRQQALNEQIQELTKKLAEAERDTYERFAEAGWNVRSIAAALKVSASTVSNRQRKLTVRSR